MGLLGSALGGKKTAGSDAGNALNLSADDANLAQGQLGKLLQYQSNPNVTDPILGSRTATSEVQNNGILGQVFGQGGTMDRTAAEEKDLSSRGYSLKPEDYEAYGQGSDQIAREFGANDSNLAQALASKGLSSSAGAGQAFAGSQGNKMERLGQLQRQIAGDRMKSNMDRLGQTRSFLSNLASQGASDINSQNSRQMGAEENNFNELKDKNSAAQSRLQAMQNQGNENMAQRAATQDTPDWVRGLSAGEDASERVGAMIATGGMSEAARGATGASAQSGATGAKKQGPNGMAGTW